MNQIQIAPENPIGFEQLGRLKMAAGLGPVLIMTHDTPDPDALASGKALAALFWSAWDIPSRLMYSGPVARVENKAMLRILTPEWERFDGEIEFLAYSAVAMVDTQPGAGNNRLPEHVIPGIVIDHHQPIRPALEAVSYVDVRTDIGATASLVAQYLDAAAVVPDADLATAIFYGVQADTKGLSRGGSLVDQAVYLQMLGRLDRNKLVQVEQAGLPREYFRAFSRGLQAARVVGNVVVCYLEQMHRADFAAEIADLLVRLEGVRAVLCLGVHEHSGREKMIYLSLRTAFGEQDAGLLVQQVIIEPGKAGGHGAAAGGQMPLGETPAGEVAQRLQDRFLEVMGEAGPGELLL